MNKKLWNGIWKYDDNILWGEYKINKMVYALISHNKLVIVRH